ncbi:hypothetical protein CL617_01415 [archaeon]|nr:hypothetical protein [archaeon]|tara:strand:+ start:1328 stop:1681 length:354 start_codon:yes stop_codon:yes gene_type:complete
MADLGNRSFGAWAFLIGVILAVIIGLTSNGNLTGTTASVLVILGLIIGFLNVTSNESQKFMLAGVVLVIVSNFGGSVIGNVAAVGTYLGGTLDAILVLVAPATVIVALKSVFELARD